jgi:hypothetical protein
MRSQCTTPDATLPVYRLDGFDRCSPKLIPSRWPTRRDACPRRRSEGPATVRATFPAPSPGEAAQGASMTVGQWKPSTLPRDE